MVFRLGTPRGEVDVRISVDHHTGPALAGDDAEPVEARLGLVTACKQPAPVWRPRGLEEAQFGSGRDKGMESLSVRLDGHDRPSVRGRRVLRCFFLPFLNKKIVLDKYDSGKRKYFWVFVFNFIFLGYLGSQTPDFPVIELGLLCTHIHLLYVFYYFLIKETLVSTYFIIKK